MEHDLKCLPEYFQAVRDGRKPFELRKDDRGFAVGDTLLLREYEPMTPGYTGEVERVRVTYCLRGGEWLAPGYVCLGVARSETPRGQWDESRCRVCGWPIRATIEEGCTIESCSQRPLPKSRADAGYAPRVSSNDSESAPAQKEETQV